MAHGNIGLRLRTLFTYDLSSNNKEQIIIGYKTLLDILQNTQLIDQLRGQHEILFACISQIILTPSNQFFNDDELRTLLELVSNSCILTMSQNQIIDGWLQNIDGRTFDKPNDDDLYEDISDESEEEQENERKTTIRGRGDQQLQKHFVDDLPRNSSNSTLFKNKNPSVIDQEASAAYNRNGHVTHTRGTRGGHQNLDRGANNNSRGARGGGNTHTPSKGPAMPVVESGKAGRRQPQASGPLGSAFDNKYGVDLRLYDCYICGEYGHVQYDCPMKRGNNRGAKFVTRGSNLPQRGGGARGGGVNTKTRFSSSSNSSPSDDEQIPNDSNKVQLQPLYNLASKLLNGAQSQSEQHETFQSLIDCLEKLDRHPSKANNNSRTVFIQKESLFYSLFCHIAQNNFLFTDEQYHQLYHFRQLLFPTKQRQLFNEDRTVFCRQRPILPLEIINEHLGTVTQIQQNIFNDLQEYVLRSTNSIPSDLFATIKQLIKSNVHIDFTCFDNFITKIIFDVKKNVFTGEQLEELQTCLLIRIKRLARAQQKQTWKERLALFKNEKLSNDIDIDKFISELADILKASDSGRELTGFTAVVDHAMWYFGVMLMASSGHLNREQYERLLNMAIESPLFNQRQKFYLRSYLEHGQAPISIEELNNIKIKFESQDSEEKKRAYEQIKIILERPRPKQIEPPVNDVAKVKDNDQSVKKDDNETIVPILDNHVMSRLISLVEFACSDMVTFTNQQCKDLLDFFLNSSQIVRPIPAGDQQRLQSFYARPVSYDELKSICAGLVSSTSTKYDIKTFNDFKSLIKQRPLTSNDALDLAARTLVAIFEDTRKFTNEQCRQLKNITEKRQYGKKRFQMINQAYQKTRATTTLIPTPTATTSVPSRMPPINPVILNQLLANVLLQDYQAHLEVFTLLEQMSNSVLNEKTLASEINCCLLAAIVLVIAEADFSNSANIDFFRRRLHTIMQQQPDVFQILLTVEQHALVTTRLSSTSEIDPLISDIKEKGNEHLGALLDFVHYRIEQRVDFQKVINLLLFTFDNPLSSPLTIDQTLALARLIQQHPKANDAVLKNLLQFLIDLLEVNIHCSPKVLLDQIESKTDDDETLQQISTMLHAENSKYAVADWKRAMITLLTRLFDRQSNDELRQAAQQSPMLQTATFKRQLEAYWKTTPSTVSKEPLIDHSAIHRELFRGLESDDTSLNSLVVQQLRTILLDEILPSHILLAKFMQALQAIFKNHQKFAQISLDEWSTLIEHNRSKIFSNDLQCDQLQMNILFARLNMPNDSFLTLNRLIQSKKAHERQDGFNRLLYLLTNTQIENNIPVKYYLTTGFSDHLYDIVTRVVFDEAFNNKQVKQCLIAARNCSLFNVDHRQKLHGITPN